MQNFLKIIFLTIFSTFLRAIAKEENICETSSLFANDDVIVEANVRYFDRSLETTTATAHLGTSV
jgi:hypothetical protein